MNQCEFVVVLTLWITLHTYWIKEWYELKSVGSVTLHSLLTIKLTGFHVTVESRQSVVQCVNVTFCCRCIPMHTWVTQNKQFALWGMETETVICILYNLILYNSFGHPGPGQALLSSLGATLLSGCSSMHIDFFLPNAPYPMTPV